MSNHLKTIGDVAIDVSKISLIHKVVSMVGDGYRFEAVIEGFSVKIEATKADALALETARGVSLSKLAEAHKSTPLNISAAALNRANQRS